MQNPPTIITTPDGSRTAHNSRFGEAYGSRHGAQSQAHHVFLEGTETHTHPAPRVLEIGFGVGVNFRATLADAQRRGVPLEYVAYEFDPAPAEVLREVALGGEGAEHPIWAQLLELWPAGEGENGHTPPLPLLRNALPHGWGGENMLTTHHQNIRLTVHFADVLASPLPDVWATALYLDGFSPSRNPEVWTPEFVARLAGALAPGGILATYSAAGHVRRAMAAAGLTVERRPGAPGKRECLRAIKVVGSGL